MSSSKKTSPSQTSGLDNTTSTTASKDYKTIQEGSAQMCYPADQEEAVFYNPVQVQNRDLSILMIALFQERHQQRWNDKLVKKQQQQQQQQPQTNASSTTSTPVDYDGISILDALAASGLRSIRYFQEIDQVRHVTINDLEDAAIERAHVNIQHNQLQEKSVPTASQAGIYIQQGDARATMYSNNNNTTPYHVIDLDPYGSAAPFLDAAVQCVESGGLLCVTCTDMAALGGSHPETCFGRYGSMPLQRAAYLQEMAVRILLDSMAKTAAKYGRTIQPILSVGIDFYVRVFVEIHKSKQAVNDLSLMTGYVLQSTQCPSFHVVPAGQMGGKNNRVYQSGRLPPDLQTHPTTLGTMWKLAGPLWLGPLHDTDILDQALQRLNDAKALPHLSTKERLKGLLTSCREELNDVPLFYKLPDLVRTLSVSQPPLQHIQSALINAGYRVSGYHKEPLALKTDAPNHVVWDILRAWCATQPSGKKLSDVATRLRSAPSHITVDFTTPKSLPKRDASIKRFPMNPEAFWGPKSKAVGNLVSKKRKAITEEASDGPLLKDGNDS